MQSQKKETVNFILNESPCSVVSHCCSHNLNLSLTSSSIKPVIGNVLETYKSIAIFFSTSPKREVSWDIFTA